MVAYQEIVERVAAHAGIEEAERSRRAVRAVVAAVAPRLPAGERDTLREALPPALRDAVGSPRAPGVDDPGEVARQVAESLDLPPEHAFHVSQVVLTELAEARPELGEGLRAALAGGAADLVTEPAALSGRTGDTAVPTPLTSEEVAEALSRLPDWAGGTRGLVRTVELPADRIPPLLTRVNRAAREMDRHAEHERSGDSITFILRTSSVNAVTEQDVRLAERVDAAVEAVGSGG